MRALLFLFLFSVQSFASIQTFTYKKVGDLDIQLDVHGADENLRPVLIWIHGGGLIQGHRDSVKPKLLKLALEKGYIVASIDYRLAPEAKLPAIIEDVNDALIWVKENGPSLFNAKVDRLAVAGSSAGGYLTLMTGLMEPQPDVLVSFWGYGDIIGDWYAKPNRHHKSSLTRKQAWKLVGQKVLSNSKDKNKRTKFYKYLRSKGEWPKAVTGWDPKADIDLFQPYLPNENVDGEYPPTFLIHGTKDKDVPIGQSVLMAERLLEAGVAYELRKIKGAGHGLKRGKKADIDKAYRDAMEFIDRNMKKVQNF